MERMKLQSIPQSNRFWLHLSSLITSTRIDPGERKKNTSTLCILYKWLTYQGRHVGCTILIPSPPESSTSIINAVSVLGKSWFYFLQGFWSCKPIIFSTVFLLNGTYFVKWKIIITRWLSSNSVHNNLEWSHSLCLWV